MSVENSRCDWSKVSLEPLFFHLLTAMDSVTFFIYLSSLNKRWSAAQRDDRCYRPGRRCTLD